MVDQTLFMIAAQPGRASLIDQLPDRGHAGLNFRSTIDEITAKNQLIVGWQNGQELQQRLITAMNIPNHPVMRLRSVNPLLMRHIKILATL